MKIGIIGALPEEVSLLEMEMNGVKKHHYAKRDYLVGKLYGKEVILVLSRIGKVAAAATTTTLINTFGAELIIFTGVAGAGDKNVNVGDIVIADKLIQHDIDASPIFPKYEIPLLEKSYFETDEALRLILSQAVEKFIQNEVENNSALANFGITHPRFHIGTIASGDQFIRDHTVLTEIKNNIPDLKCVEMEGAAVAQVCYEHQIPFLIIRTISDNADHSAPVDFNRFVTDVASHYSRDVIKYLFELI